ncbi:hypothetical protein AUR64_11525 [Haloprofundus marisrubri]|uniref:Uncharacterized protein n=1 Tax=Haloprofundus marisrubri TaxID=1514971 RepID=A0A0W1RAB8_9EURY|nr:DUF5787 family protein [Haloprofundus marisrubri]KTG10208.1 hypothetical protein AUR64_11525 [Haloprofundus marisrubri]
MSYPADSEFVFELLTCRWAERAWPPESERESALVVARQLGTKKRRWDTVVVEADPEALAARAAFGDDELDSDLLHIVRHAPADWAWYRDALPHPGYPWRYVLAAIHRAAARGVVEKRRTGRRIEIRRVAPYPDWVRRIVAVENKPDLDASAARALSGQLEHDVETALADEVWLATAATGNTVEPALLENIPVDVGILALDFSDGVVSDAGDVAWYPSSLSSDAKEGESEADTDRTETRLRLAERAYGRGWRSYHETMRPDCRHFELRREGDALLPWCAAKECHQTAAECSGSCDCFQPEPPQWRTNGWPIEGGPGKGIKRLLAQRREHVRKRSPPDT